MDPLIGAVMTRRRVGDEGKKSVPAVVVLLVTLAYLTTAVLG